MLRTPSLPARLSLWSVWLVKKMSEAMDRFGLMLAPKRENTQLPLLGSESGLFLVGFVALGTSLGHVFEGSFGPVEVFGLDFG